MTLGVTITGQYNFFLIITESHSGWGRQGPVHCSKWVQLLRVSQACVQLSY